MARQNFGIGTTLVLLLLLPGRINAQQGADDAAKLKKVLMENHYQPRVINDEFSRNVFDRVINTLDPDKLYFTAGDLLSLEPFRNSLDDEWKDSKSKFTERLTLVFTASLQKADLSLRDALRQRINWKLNEQLPRPKNLSLAKDNAALSERWRLWVKYRILEEMQEESMLDSPRVEVTYEILLKTEAAHSKKVAASESKAIQSYAAFAGGISGKVTNAYLKSIASEFDPHSLYLSPSEGENFMGELTSQEFTFGMELKEEQGGDISVSRLLPGGPAWKSGELHTGDVLVSLKPEGKKTIDLEHIGIDSLGELMDLNNHLGIELTVRKSDGNRKTVFLRKEKLEDDSSIVKGFVLHGKNRVGYISLPGFYSEWGSDLGSGCAADMARQILKMKKENIEGLIVDIRSNGGGSVAEAIELAGIFIDEGPLALFKDRNGVITTLKDVNRGTIYDGPLVILINGRSASASELLAAALQDYHRAILIGTPTFGKATGQRVIPLGVPNPNMAAGKKNEVGIATVTIEKIYRVTGKSVQGYGVLPDITLPTLYDQLLPHEAELSRALPSDSVKAKLPFKAKPMLPLQRLNEKSKTRVAASSWFGYIRETGATIAAEVKKDKEFVLLDWYQFLNSPLQSIREMNPGHTEVIQSITPPAYDKALEARNPWEKENNIRWIRNLQRDEYVTEAFKVIGDYLAIKTQKP